MKNRKRRLNVFFMMTAAAVLSLCGCREVNDTLYLHYDDIPTEGWRTYDSRCFKPVAADSARLGRSVSLQLVARYSARQPIGTLPVICSIEDENGELMCDTVRLNLFDPEGRPVGRRRFGLCETTVTLKNKIPLTRALSVCLIPLAPQRASAGLRNVGIKMCYDGSDSTAPRKSR